MNKSFFPSDALIFEPIYIDTDTLPSTHPTFIRKCNFVVAAPNVTTEDILKEVQEIEDRIELGIDMRVLFNKHILTTTLTEYPDMVIALTYKGFVERALDIFNDSGKLRCEKYRDMANELITLRSNPDYNPALKGK
jgi:hypothetical protein